MEEYLQLHKEILRTLLGACMSLCKWCTNSNTLSSRLSSEQAPNYVLKLNENDTVRTLGVAWNPHEYCFQFILNEWIPPTCMTK